MFVSFVCYFFALLPFYVVFSFLGFFLAMILGMALYAFSKTPRLGQTATLIFQVPMELCRR